MDLSKLKPGDWLIGGGAVVFLISMFLPWYRAEVNAGPLGSYSGSSNGWDYALQGWIPLLLLLAAAAAIVLPKLADGVKVPETFGPVSRVQAALIASGVAAALVLLRLIIKDGDDVFGIEIKRGLGLFLALLASLAAVAGSFMKSSGREEDVTASGPSL